MTEQISSETARLYETEKDLNIMLKRASQVNVETQYHIAQRLNDIHFRFSTAPPEVAREAFRIAAEEHSMIYLDFLQKLIRLHEELSDRMIDASSHALQRCSAARAAREKASERRSKRKTGQVRKGRKARRTTTASEKST